MLRQIAFIFLLSAGPVQATQEYLLPTLFNVQGVASDDVLNIRQQPDAASPIIGRLQPNATKIEIVEEARGWGRVNHGEASGWVSMRFLAYRTDVWEPGKLPAAFRCLGTEPFWDLRAVGGNAVLSGPEHEPLTGRIQAILDTGIFRDPTRALVAEGVTLIATPQQCSDGMSDRLYGMRANVILQRDQPAMLTGCCTVQP